MTEAVLICANHPGRETSLRCNRCEKPICSQCAVHTPVGYRCQECVRGQQRTFNTTQLVDYPIALVTAAAGVGVAVSLLGFLGFWGFFLAPIVGGGVAEIVRWAVRKRRSRRLPLVASVGGVAGVLPHLLLPMGAVFLAAGGQGGAALLGRAALSVLWPIVYGVLMISALYYRLRGIWM